MVLAVNTCFSMPKSFTLDFTIDSLASIGGEKTIEFDTSKDFVLQGYHRRRYVLTWYCRKQETDRDHAIEIS